MPNSSTTPAPEHLRRLNAALALREVPDYAAALAQLQRAVSIAPSESLVHLMLGLTYQDLGETEAAEPHLRQAVSLDPHSIEARHALADFLLRQGQAEAAIDELRPVVQGSVHHVPSARLMASALAQTGKTSAAIAILQASYEHSPTDVELTIELGQLLLKSDRPTDARPLLEQAISQRPTAELLCDLAAVYSLEDQYEQALKLLEQAREQQSDFDRAWRGLAYCYLKLERLEEALAAAERALELNADHYRNWQIKAQVLLEMERHQDAWEVLEHGIDLARGKPGAEAVLAELLIARAVEVINRDGFEAGLAQVDRDQREFAHDIGLWQFKTDILVFLGRFEEALATVNEAIDKGLPLRAARLVMFEILHGLGRPDEGLAAIQPLPDNSASLNDLFNRLNEMGFRLYMRGEIAAARSIFDQLLHLNPEDGGLHNNLGYILAGGGQWEQAEAHFRKALDLNYEHPEIVLANLGHAYLRLTRYDKAMENLAAAEQRATGDDTAFLRIAYWINGAFSDSAYDQHPPRPMRVRIAVRANFAMAQLLAGQPEEALQTAQSAIDADPEDSVGYKVLGCVAYALERFDVTRSAWGIARDRAVTPDGRAIIETWLSLLPTGD